MKIHEYQSYELFKTYGIPVPRGILVETADQAGEAVNQLGGRAIIKGQVLTGGRGKAGAVQKVSSNAEARTRARNILSMKVKGYLVQKVFIVEPIEIEREYYLGITIDREKKAIILILSEAGGMDIEDIAKKEPEKIRYYEMGHGDKDLRAWLFDVFNNDCHSDQAFMIVKNMYRLFRDNDCSLVEINPLVLTKSNTFIAADAKIVFDDNALRQHPEIARLSNPEEYTDDEHHARAAGLSFVNLSGDIGCMVNGAGLAMATMDSIKLAGGSAANFLDVGGSSNPTKVLEAMCILLKNKVLKVILINIFGGITRCDDIARGILQARNQLNISVPIVIRLIGTNENTGRRMLEENGMTAFRSMTQAVFEAVRISKGL